MGGLVLAQASSSGEFLFAAVPILATVVFLIIVVRGVLGGRKRPDRPGSDAAKLEEPLLDAVIPGESTISPKTTGPSLDEFTSASTRGETPALSITPRGGNVDGLESSSAPPKPAKIR